MYALRQVISYLWSCGQWLDNAGNACDGIPLVGSVVGYPLHWVAYWLYLSSNALYDFDQWIDGVSATVNAAYSNAIQSYNYAYGWLTDQVNSAISAADSAFSYATGYLTGLANQAMSTATSAYQYASGFIVNSLNSLISEFNNMVAYVSFQVNNTGATAWTYITSGYLQNYLNNWFSGLSTLTVEQIAGSMGYLISAGFDYLNRYWSSFTGAFTWLLDKLIDLIKDQSAHFAEALWSLFETIVGELSQWEK